MIYLFNVKKELNKIIPRTNLISFIQELEINGLYLSEVELPLFYKTEYGQYYNHKKTFDSASFFGFFDTKKKFQLYKIHTRKVDGRLLIVSGVHLFFDEAKAMSVVRDKRLIDVDAASATNTVFNGTGWTVKSSDVTPLKSIDFYYQTPQEARSRIIESWNIEFDYDLTFDGKKITSKNIYIKKKLGVWTGDRYSYGTNILSIVQEQDEAEVFTAAIGRGTSDDTNTALNAKVLFDDLSWSKDGYTKPLGQDYIEIPSATAQYGYYDSNGNVKPRIAVIDFEDIQDQKILADKTYEWLKQNCVPKVSYQTTVAKAGDYYLGDEIGIIYKDIDIVKKARVEKIKVNMLNPKLSELGLGDYQFFKQDRFKKNIRNEISTVKKDTLTGIQKIRQEFSDQFDVTKQEWEAQIQQVEINATAQVQAAETRMNEQLSAAKSDLSGQISNSYSSAVQAAELKAKELDAVVTNQINSTKTTLSNDITSAYNKAVTDAETKAKALDAAITQTVTANKQAADKTIGELNTTLNSTNNKVGTIEQNVTAAQQNIATLMNTTNAQQTAIQNAQGDISGLKTTVGQHTSSISNLDNQIKLTATKTEVTDAVNGIVIGGVNLLRDSAKERTGNRFLMIDIYQVLQGYVGQPLTISFDIKTSIARNISVYPYQGHGLSFKDNKYVIPRTDIYTRFSLTTTVYDWGIRGDQYTKGALAFYDNVGDNTITVKNIQLEIGTKPTPYDISPFDRDALISQNAAAIVVANDEITKRVTKTEFNTKTGQIEQIANTAKSTADSNTQTITTVKGNVDALSQWKADKGTAIDQTIDSVSNKAWLTDINPITKRVETAEASITTNANEILKRVTKTEFDSTTGRIEGVANTAKSTATSNTAAITTVSGRVGTLEQWRTDKGSQIDQTIDAVTTKVWQNDIDALNFLNSNLFVKNSLYQSKSDTNVKYNGYESFYIDNGWKEYCERYLVKGDSYITISGFAKVKAGTPTSIGIHPVQYDSETGTTRSASPVVYKSIGNDWTYFVTNIKTSTLSKSATLYLSVNPKTAGFEMWVSNLQIEVGTKATPYQPSPKDAQNRMTEIKQTADGALMKATTIGNDYVKQSAVLVQPDGVLIGSKKVSGTEMASAISVTPSNVDIITRVMRVTGDMQVAGDIKSLSLSAVYADIANLRANVITADSVTSTALKVDTALIQKLNTNALLTNYLTADTAMINSIKSNALTAVRADIAWLKANVITADSITSTALKVDTALMDKLNVNSILTNKLLADTAMINAIKSNAITAVRGDIAYLKANIITADSITSTALKADISMVNKLFAQDAYITALTSKSAFIKEIQAIEVIAYRLEARDKQASVNIENGSITMNRDNGSRMDISLNGIQSFNSGGSLLFSLTPTLVTTSAVGTSVSNVYLGTAPNAEARVVNMNGIPGDGEIGSYAYRPIRTLAIKFPLKANGYIGIDGNELRIMSDGLVEGGYKSVRADKGYFSTVDANNEISGAHFYIRPKRGGELRATYNDGGETSYANFRSDGIYAPWIDYNGHIPGSHFYIRPAYGGEVRLTATGTTNNWANLRSDGIYAPWIDYNGQIPGSHLYIRPGSGGEVKFTRTGTTDVWADIRFGSWNAMSHEKYKNNIEKWNYNVLDIYKNDLVLHSYKVNSESDTLYARIHHGIVLRENSNLDQFPAEWRNGDGFDGNEVLWWNTKAVQELAYENDELRNKISDLENRLKILEDKLNG